MLSFPKHIHVAKRRIVHMESEEAEEAPLPMSNRERIQIIKIPFGQSCGINRGAETNRTNR